MVKLRIYWLIVLSLCLTHSLMASDMSASIDGTQLYPDVPINGLITISHNQNEKIDEAAFQIGNDSLIVEKIKDVKISGSSPILLTIYRFHLEGKKVGVYSLPAISTRVGGVKISSIPSMYEITPAPQGTPAAPLEHPFLRLEALIDGPPSLYPSQQTRFVYRYFFNANVALTVEQLPLLTADGVVKIGEKEVRNLQEGGITATQIAQVVEASTPGTYTYGPSFIEGYAYRTDAEGNILERSSLLRSEAPVVTLAVLPFPDNERPPAFNGAVGDFTFNAELNGEKDVNLGGDLSLILKIQGDQNIAAVPLPDICCQPGFVGAFQVSDLPPVETVQGKIKKAIILIKPLSSAITEIPPVTFSFFNPATKTYVQLVSESIPIVVHGKLESQVPGIVTVSTESKGPTIPSLLLHKPGPLSKADLYALPLGSHWVLWLFPLGILFILYQFYLARRLKQTRKRLQQSSEGLLRAAKGEVPGSARYYQALVLALKQRLVEARAIPERETPLSQWPQEGAAREAADWIARIDELRFSGKEAASADRAEKKVEELFTQMVVPTPLEKDPPLFLYGPTFLFALLFAWVLWVPSAHRPEPRLQLADETYQKALEMVELYPRQTALLDALRQYQILAFEHRSQEGTGHLSAVISTLYAHLGRYPEALWHARRALSLSPHDSNLIANIDKLKEALFIDRTPEEKWIRFLPTGPQGYQLFACIVLVAILSSSLAIWTFSRTTPVFKWSGVAVLLAAVPLLYLHYFAPLYGTVLVSSDLRAGPALSYPRIGTEPVPSGSTLEVLAPHAQGQWLQVYTPQGETGFVPSSSVGL